MSTLKLALTSDLYSPVTPVEKIVAVARAMAEFAPDTAVLAGDLAESLVDFTRVLGIFRKELSCPIRVLPGDVDFWARPPYDSQRLWTELLPRATEQMNCDWLEGKAFLHEGIALTGSIAWYDYSSATMAGIVSDLEFAQQKYLHSADALRIDWEYSDPEFAGLVSTALLSRLDHLDQDPQVQQVVVVTHFPILEAQLVREPGMSFASAYMGNLTLGRKVLTRGKVRHIISGHTHAARSGEVIRDRHPPLEYHVLGGTYDRPAWLGLTINT